jgi:hypothetical protein
MLRYPRRPGSRLLIFGMAVSAALLTTDAQAQFSRRGALSIARRANSANAARAKAMAKNYAQAQKNLAADQAKLAEAQTALGKARRDYKSAVTHKKQTLKETTASEETELKVPQALEAVTSARKAYDEASVPILKAIHETGEYKKVAEKSESARQELEALRKDEDLSQEVKRARIIAATGASMAATEYEHDALAANKTLKPFREEYEAAATRLVELRAQVKANVESNSLVRASEAEVDSTKARVDSAQAEVEMIGSAVALAEEQFSNGVVPAGPDGGNVTAKKKK